MCRIFAVISILSLIPFSVSGQEPKAKADYVAFSKLVHGMVVKQLPKQFADASGWGQRTEVPPNLPLWKLRTIYKVGDHLEAPHGTWRKFVGKLEEPNKNLVIVIKDFKQRDAKTWRVVADVDVTVLIDVEVQQWQKGLLLVGGKALVDANATAAIVCDVNVSLDLKEFPPALKLEPKVTDLGLNFVDFKVRGGPFIKGELGDSIRSDLKDWIRTAVKASEPAVKDQVDQALAQSLKESKNDISLTAILKALPMTPKVEMK